MSPPTGTPSPNSEEDPMALAEARAALESIARRKGIVAEDDDYAEDDDVPTDEEGYEIPSVQTAAAPDRRIVPSTDAEPEGSLDRVVSAPLGIQQVDDLKDEAKAEGMDVAGDDD